MEASSDPGRAKAQRQEETRGGSATWGVRDETSEVASMSVGCGAEVTGLPGGRGGKEDK